jgi:hypothetical protein
MAKAELAKTQPSCGFEFDGRPQLRLRIESASSPRAVDAGGNADDSVTIGGRAAETEIHRCGKW